MNNKEAMDLISKALEVSCKRPVEFSMDSDLVADNILDSLDTLVFLMELENIAGVKIPDDVDLLKEGYYRISKLVDLICKN